jgi:hypothetical protein
MQAVEPAASWYNQCRLKQGEPMAKTNSPKNKPDRYQKGQRTQQILFAAVGLIIIATMILSLLRF